MAVLLGVVTASPQAADPVPGMSASLSTAAADIWPAGSSVMSASVSAIPAWAVVGAPVGAVLVGEIIEMFGGDLQQGVTLSPLVLNLGTVARDTTYKFKMRNQYLVPITLTGIVPTGDDGLTLGFAAGLAFDRTQEKILTLTAIPAGPQTIAATYTLTFDVAGTQYSIDLVVVGTRTQVWEFPISWGDRVTVAYAYLTDSFKPRSGRQQRRATRHNPRVTMGWTSMVRRDNVRKAEAQLAGKQNQITAVVDPSSGIATTTAAYSGENRLSFAALPSWGAVGGLVALPTAAGTAIYEIAAVGADYVDLVPELQTDYAAGTVAQAIHRGYLSGQLGGRYLSSAVLMLNMSFTAIPPAAKRPDPPAAPVTFNGREVFLTRPNWGVDPTVEFQFESTPLDFGRGTFEWVPMDLFPTRLTTWGFTCKGRQAIADMRAFHDRQYGARGQFYAPTWKKDFLPVGDLASGAAIFTAKGETVAEELAGSTVFRHLIVMLKDGTHLIREVLDQTLDGFGNTLIVVDVAWPAQLAPESIIMISWLNLCSLGSDILTLSLLTDSVATTTLAFATDEDID